MIIDMKDPVLGEYKVQGIPLKLSRTPGEIRTTAPEIGQDNADIFKSLGYSEEEIAALHESNVI